MKTFIKKIITKIFSFANKDLFLRIDSLQNQNEDLKSQILKNDAEIRAFVLQLGNETENSFSQIQDSLNRLETNQKTLETNQKTLETNQKTLETNQKTLETKQLVFETHSHYKYVREQILEKLSQGEKLRFGSYVVYDTTFGAHGICELMLKEPEKYDVKFVICPDTYRDMGCLTQYHKTKQFFIERYGADRVLDGYDEKREEFVDWSDSFDVVYMANPYDVLVNRIHGIRYMSTRNVLPFFICYGYIVSKWFMKGFVSSTECSLLYKYFVETKQTELECGEYQLAEGRNIILSGYPKMDALAVLPEVKNSRKKILIAPHHTVKGIGDENDLQLSNFLDYSDFILELPDLYPQADFVFRPHPLLFKNLLMRNFWTQEQVDSYIEKIQSKKNVVYSTESEYLHLFRECDAIIHDCGSYMVEWLYTGKPCCYVVETEDHTRKQLSRLCNEALSLHTVIADSREKILDFISRVLNDEFQVHIDESVQSRIMVNYPNSSQLIFENLLK